MAAQCHRSTTASWGRFIFVGRGQAPNPSAWLSPRHFSPSRVPFMRAFFASCCGFVGGRRFALCDVALDPAEWFMKHQSNDFGGVPYKKPAVFAFKSKGLRRHGAPLRDCGTLHDDEQEVDECGLYFPPEKLLIVKWSSPENMHVEQRPQVQKARAASLCSPPSPDDPMQPHHILRRTERRLKRALVKRHRLNHTLSRQKAPTPRLPSLLLSHHPA